MKIFSWMQNKLNGRQKTNKIGSLQVANNKEEARKEDIMVWPNGLLTIGTFGINNLKNPPNSPRKDKLELDDDFDIPIDDQLQELFSLQKGTSLPPENFLAILRDLQDGGTSSCNESNGENSNSSSKNVQSFKDTNHLDKKKSVRKRALQFLLRKSFLRGGKPMLNPILKDPFDLKLEKSRLEKILRTILHKQVHPQGSTTNSSTRICLDTKHVMYNECKEETLEEEDEEEDDEEEEEEQGSKWVKTDSEYIVLEI